MSKENFLNEHWKQFVKFISSLPMEDLEQQREDYALLASEDPEAFKPYFEFIVARFFRRRQAA